MAFGRAPWKRAIMSDNCYRLYVDRPNFLREMLPISEGAHEILQRTLALDPKNAIDLRSLRRLVEDLDTFYMNEEDVRAAGGHIEETWNKYSPQPAGPRRVCPGQTGSSVIMVPSSNSLQDDSDDSDERPAGVDSFMLNRLEQGQPVRRIIFPGPTVVDRLVHASSNVDTSSSEVDSWAPLTPQALRAQDPAIAVPELSVLSPVKTKKSRSFGSIRLLRRLVGNIIAA